MNKNVQFPCVSFTANWRFTVSVLHSVIALLLFSQHSRINGWLTSHPNSTAKTYRRHIRRHGYVTGQHRGEGGLDGFIFKSRTHVLWFKEKRSGFAPFVGGDIQWPNNFLLLILKISLTGGHIKPTSVREMRSWTLCIIPCTWLPGAYYCTSDVPTAIPHLTKHQSIAEWTHRKWIRTTTHHREDNICFPKCACDASVIVSFSIYNIKNDVNNSPPLHFHPRPLPLLSTRSLACTMSAPLGRNTSPLFMERVHLRARLTDQKMLMIGGSSGGLGDEWGPSFWRWLY